MTRATMAASVGAYLLALVACLAIHYAHHAPVAGQAVAAHEFTACTSLGHGMTRPTCGILTLPV